MIVQKHKSFTLETKVYIIQCTENVIRFSDVCKQLDLSKGTVSTELKNKHKILGAF